MTLKRRCAYVGAAVILCAMLIRLLPIGEPVWENLAFYKLLTYFYTGREPMEFTPTTLPEMNMDDIIQATHPEYDGDGPLQLSMQAGLSVGCRNGTGHKTELEKWLLEPLNWNLLGEKPTVLIVHTHTTESYKNFGQYKESDPYHTTNRKHNMAAVGDRVAEILEANGITVIHDTTLHDYPAYRNAYDRSRATALSYIEKYPNVSLVLDLHRDAVTNADGEFIPLIATSGGKTAAKVEIVVGTNAGGQTHDTWEKNAATAVKLHSVLEMEFPGICRPMLMSSNRYNQDLMPGALLIEVGSAGNTLEDALVSAEVLAKAIIKMAQGVEITK